MRKKKENKGKNVKKGEKMVKKYRKQGKMV